MHQTYQNKSPKWIEFSGLPTHLTEKGKCAWAWLFFKSVMELDEEQHGDKPGLVEISMGEMIVRTGLDMKKIVKAIKACRKTGVLRAFIPDNEEETALLQIITPLETPVSYVDVYAEKSNLFRPSDPFPPKYAISQETEDEIEEKEKSKTEKVVDLYLNTFSMKLNNLIIDQLSMIARHYEFEMVKRSFQLAKKNEAATLSWVITQIKREQIAIREAKRLRSETDENV